METRLPRPPPPPTFYCQGVNDWASPLSEGLDPPLIIILLLFFFFFQSVISKCLCPHFWLETHLSKQTTLGKQTQADIPHGNGCLLNAGFTL